LSVLFKQRLAGLSSAAGINLLAAIQRGVEKESLRITPAGKLAQTAHPPGLGSALAHDYITTDYSEALLEFITPVSPSIQETVNTLEDIHRFTYSQLDDELLWGASMPCVMASDSDIPVADYGSSNVGRMKKVYRHGLGHRYGRLMQTISGIHYNFSMPEEYWQYAQSADSDAGELQDYKTRRYLGLIRNFQRYSWLLIYLFGASPAVCSSFVRGDSDHGLEPFDAESKSLYLPHATALRMGDLGYQSNAQKDLSICYNQLDSYIQTLLGAITQSHPDYEEIGLGEDHSKQLNTSLLQIENEFYSPIRPKRVTRSGEIPLGALNERGIEYIEVRCIDVSPFLPVGIDAEQMRFLDTFLLYCLLEDSPPCTEQEQEQMAENMQRIVNRGREPGLKLQEGSEEKTMSSLADSILSNLEPIVKLLDDGSAGELHSASLASQRAKLEDPALTPSARVLREMQDQQVPFFRLAMNYSQRWADSFRETPLAEDRAQHFTAASLESVQQQRELESANQIDFEAYLENYYQQYDAIADS
jgi:glutamate--cysteine ligase